MPTVVLNRGSARATVQQVVPVPWPLAPAERCHTQSAHRQRVPRPCLTVPCQPWVLHRVAWDEHRAQELGWGRQPGEGGTGAVPGVLIRGMPVRHTLLPTPCHAPLGQGLCPGGCPGQAGNSKGRQPRRDALLAPLFPGPGTLPAHHGRGQGDMERHRQHCRQHCQEHFLPLRRKVCAGSGNTESFPERGEMSWQQRESPVSWEGLAVSPSLTVAPCHSLALNTTDHGPSSPHQGGLCGSHAAFNPPPP